MNLVDYGLDFPNALLLMFLFVVAISAVVYFVCCLRDLNDLCSNDRKGKEKQDDEAIYKMLGEVPDGKIDFLYKLNSKNYYENLLKFRDSENRTLLSHVAIYIGVCSLFFYLAKWTYHHSSDLYFFVPLVLFLGYSLVSLIFSVSCAFMALSVKYRLPPRDLDVANVAGKYEEIDLKRMILSRLLGAGELNYESNYRKMKMMRISRNFVKKCLIFLVVSFLYIAIRNFLFIMGSFYNI